MAHDQGDGQYNLRRRLSSWLPGGLHISVFTKQRSRRSSLLSPIRTLILWDRNPALWPYLITTWTPSLQTQSSGELKTSNLMNFGGETQFSTWLFCCSNSFRLGHVQLLWRSFIITPWWWWWLLLLYLLLFKHFLILHFVFFPHLIVLLRNHPHTIKIFLI